MRKLSRGKVLASGALLCAAYLVLAWALPTLAFIDVLNGIFVGILFAVMAVYMPVVVASVKSQTFDRTAQLAVGIGCIWASLAIARLYSAWLFANGKSGGFLISPVGGFAIFLAIIGGALHITAPGYPAEQDPPMPVAFAGRNRWLLLASGVIGGIVALLLRVL